MADIGLIERDGSFDLAIKDGQDLVTDLSLASAVIMTLFSKRQSDNRKDQFRDSRGSSWLVLK